MYALPFQPPEAQHQGLSGKMKPIRSRYQGQEAVHLDGVVQNLATQAPQTIGGVPTNQKQHMRRETFEISNALRLLGGYANIKAPMFRPVHGKINRSPSLGYLNLPGARLVRCPHHEILVFEGWNNEWR